MTQRYYILIVLLSLTLLSAKGQTDIKNSSDTIKCVLKSDTLNDRQIYLLVDSMPQFPGGVKAMITFILTNFNYLNGDDMTGTVFVSVIVEPTGILTNIKIRRSVAPSLDKEALSVVAKMPKWIPGSCKGTAVPVEMIIPFRITLH